MTDKPKTIQEALAQVQKNVIEQELPSTVEKGAQYDSILKRGYNFAKRQVDAAKKTITSNDPNAPTGSVPSSNSPPPAPTGSAATLATPPISAARGDRVIEKRPVKPGDIPSKAPEPAKNEPAKTEPAKTEPPKPEPAKMSFDDAYAKARQMAKAAGKDPNTAQFKFDRGGGEKVYQSAATKSDYVPMDKQFKVDIDAPSTTKNPAGPNATVDAPLPPKKPAKIGENQLTNPLIAAFLQLQEKNPSNMFEAAKKAKEDHDGDGEIESGKNEYFGSRFAAAKKAGKMEEDEQIDEATGLKKVVHKVFGKQIAKHRANKADSEMERTLNTRGSEKKWAKNYDARERYGRIAAGKPPFKDMDEEDEQIDEISVGTADSYLSKRTEQARKGLLPGDRNPTSKTELKNMTNAANRTDKDYYKNRGFKKVGEETEVDEELKGSQHKIDANKNNKIDAHDFKLLRSKKKMKEDAEETKLPKDWGEGVEFSEEELAFFASVEETFTPTEPGRVNKDQAGHTDLNDEVTEAKKKVEEPSGDRDARQHIQVIAGRAAAGNTLDFPHNNGKSTKINPQMGRKITAHLNSLKPAERQAKVKAMHDSPEGMKF